MFDTIRIRFECLSNQAHGGLAPPQQAHLYPRNVRSCHHLQAEPSRHKNYLSSAVQRAGTIPPAIFAVRAQLSIFPASLRVY
jgi:hypothetical protein